MDKISSVIQAKLNLSLLCKTSLANLPLVTSLLTLQKTVTETLIVPLHLYEVNTSNQLSSFKKFLKKKKRKENSINNIVTITVKNKHSLLPPIKVAFLQHSSEPHSLFQSECFWFANCLLGVCAIIFN